MYHPRRDILRGLAAFSLGSLAHAYGGEQKSPAANTEEPAGECEQNKPCKAEKDTLNIIFHGAFCFIHYNDHFQAITREVMGHVYGAGNWKKEYYMGKGTYYLTGVKNQELKGKDVKTDNALIIPPSEIGAIDPQNLAYCKVVIPIPARIAPLGLFTPPGKPNMFIGKNAKYGNDAKNFGTSHVFTYHGVKLDDYDNPVGLSGTYWKPDPPNGLNATNLHIFATSCFQLDLHHTPRTFQSSMEMLTNAAIEMDPGTVGMQFKYQDPKPYPGVLDEEQLPLHLTLKSTKLVPPRICDAPSAFVSSSLRSTSPGS